MFLGRLHKKKTVVFFFFTKNVMIGYSTFKSPGSSSRTVNVEIREEIGVQNLEMLCLCIVYS